MEDKYVKAVESGNLNRVRLFLSNELMLDPRGNSFHEMLTFAENKLNDLYEMDNGSRNEKDAALWDKDFLFQLKNELDRNFSREKLNYYEQVAKQVLKDKARQLDEEEAKQQQRQESHGIEQQTENFGGDHKKQVFAGVTIGGAVLTTIGLCVPKAALTVLGKATLTSLGIVGLAVGGYMLYKETKKK